MTAGQRFHVWARFRYLPRSSLRIVTSVNKKTGERSTHRCKFRVGWIRVPRLAPLMQDFILLGHKLEELMRRLVCMLRSGINFTTPLDLKWSEAVKNIPIFKHKANIILIIHALILTNIVEFRLISEMPSNKNDTNLRSCHLHDWG